MKKLIFAAALSFAGLVASAAAGTLPAPTDKPILTISGTIENQNQAETALFDRAMLEALGMETIETTTPWHDGSVTFEGVRLDKLMDYVGATGKQVVAVALNDYSSELPVEDFSKHNPILALKLNGEYMPVSDKGPLFIIYPFDSDSELQSQTYYGRSVWQVSELIVK
jgi:hypothetical protein